MHAWLGGRRKLGGAGDHEARPLEHDVAPRHIGDQVGRRGLRLDRPDSSDQVLVEKAFGHAAERNRSRQERLGADVAHVEERLGGVDCSPQPAAGCVVVGKANMHEFAYGITSVNPHYGPVRNPRDSSRVAGGSSGGSAVAVAAGMCDWAVGSDTGGSIRIPASFCGVAGFKPDFASIDIGRVIPLAYSLDTLGPLAMDIASTARAYSMMSGETVSLDGVDRPTLAVPAG